MDLLNTELRQFPLQSLQFPDGVSPHFLALHEVPDSDPEELFSDLVRYDHLAGGTQGGRVIKDIDSNAEFQLCPDSFSILVLNKKNIEDQL